MPFKLVVSSKATVRQLLAHAAGVTVHGFTGPLGASVPPLDDVLKSTPPVNEPVRATPDRAEMLATLAPVVLERVLTDITATSYPAFLRETVLEPAGIRSATYTPDRDGLSAPGRAGAFAVLGSAIFPGTSAPTRD